MYGGPCAVFIDGEICGQDEYDDVHADPDGHQYDGGN